MKMRQSFNSARAFPRVIDLPQSVYEENRAEEGHEEERRER